MGKLRRIITPLHKKSSRDYVARMVDEKVACMKKAKRYGKDYWDGDRRYGYGGYHYDGRWSVVAKKLIKTYGLPGDAKILDVGCGKGFLLYEFMKLLPDCTVVGIDASAYAISHAKPEVKKFLRKHRAEDVYPYETDAFDLVYSNTTLHNLELPDLEQAIREIERVGKNKFICVESYRNEQELFNLQCWALTCEAFYSKQEWVWLYEHFGYTGDYEFIYFE